MGGMREYTEKRMLRLAGLLTEAAGDDLSPEMGPMAQPPMMQQVGAGEEAQGPEWEAFKAAVDAYNDQMTAELDLLRDIAIVPDPGAYWSAGIRTFDEFREELAREAEHEAAKDLIRRVADEAEEGAGAAEMHYDPADMYDVDPYGRSGNLPMWQESRSSGRPLKERVYTIDLKSLLAEGGPPPIPPAARIPAAARKKPPPIPTAAMKKPGDVYKSIVDKVLKIEDPDKIEDYKSLITPIKDNNILDQVIEKHDSQIDSRLVSDPKRNINLRLALNSVSAERKGEMYFDF